MVDFIASPPGQQDAETVRQFQQLQRVLSQRLQDSSNYLNKVTTTSQSVNAFVTFNAGLQATENINMQYAGRNEYGLVWYEQDGSVRIYNYWDNNGQALGWNIYDAAGNYLRTPLYIYANASGAPRVETQAVTTVRHSDFPHFRMENPNSASGIKGWSMYSHPTENTGTDSLRVEWWDNALGYGGAGLRVGTTGIAVDQNIQMYNPITTTGAANVHMDGSGYMRKFTSLAEFKENVGPVISAIDALKPVTFDSKHEADHGKRFAGFIAEDVWAAIPEARMEDAYDVNAIVAHLVKEVQELKRRINELGG